MSGREDDSELGAIEQLISALEPLQADARHRVLGYVFQRLGLTGTTAAAGSPLAPIATPLPGGSPPSPAAAANPQMIDIRTFAAQKAPSSQVERTALVAFYLSEVAPPAERKAEITGADLTKYSKQAGLPAPTDTRQALFRARHAGYLDTAGHGKYRLNAVGYNLVAHNLPGGSAPSSARTKRAKGRRASSGKSKAKRRSR